MRPLLILFIVLNLTACFEPDSKTVTVKDTRAIGDSSVKTKVVSDADFAALQQEVKDLKAALIAVNALLATHTGQVAALSNSGGVVVGPVLYGSYTINNSLDVSFLNPVTWVTGNLRIDAYGMPSLSLPNLVGVGGALTIQNTGIKGLSGLSGLLHVGAHFYVSGNPLLTTVDGISGLAIVGGDVNISSNPVLTNVAGLSGINSIGGSISFYNNAALSNLDGMSGLSNLGGFLNVQDNIALTSLAGLSGLSSVGGYLKISGNDSLTNLTGLSGLASIGGSLNISGNAALNSLGLSALTGDMHGYVFSIAGNPNLCQTLVTAFQGQVTNLGTTDVSGNNNGC